MAEPPRKAPLDESGPTLVNPRHAKQPFADALEPAVTARHDESETAELDAHAPETQRVPPVQGEPSTVLMTRPSSLEPETRPAPAAPPDPSEPAWPPPPGITGLLKTSEPPPPGLALRPIIPRGKLRPPPAQHHFLAWALVAVAAVTMFLAGFAAVRLSAPKRANVRIACEPEANVFINGRDLGPQPVLVELPVGPANVVLRNPQRALQRSFSFDVVAGSDNAQRFVFPKGWLEIDAPPSSAVTVDGAPVTVRRLELYEGLHRLEAIDAQQRRASRTVELTGGATTKLSLQPAP